MKKIIPLMIAFASCKAIEVKHYLIRYERIGGKVMEYTLNMTDYEGVSYCPGQLITINGQVWMAQY